MDKITQTARYRQSLIQYAGKYGVTKAAIRYRTNRQYIFSMYLRGLSIVKIKQQLESRGIPSPTGKPAWSKHTIDTILSNKKYIGTSVIYKTYNTGPPESKRVINRGARDVYEANNHHVPIIPTELFERVQNERMARSNIELDAEGKPKRKAKKYSAAKVKIE